MAGFSHPEMLSGVYRLYVKGEIDAAHDLFDIYLPLLDYEAQGFWGVAARKEVMRRRGAIRHATMRRPGPSLSGQHLAEIDLLLRRLDRSLAEAGKPSIAPLVRKPPFRNSNRLRSRLRGRFERSIQFLYRRMPFLAWTCKTSLSTVYETGTALEASKKNV